MKRTQLLTTADITREEVDFLINEAEKMRKKGTTNDLKGKVVATLFFEPSTRTRLSFESAAQRVGASVISVADASTTSTKKGETLADTIRVFDKLADLIVMRQSVPGARSHGRSREIHQQADHQWRRWGQPAPLTGVTRHADHASGMRQNRRAHHRLCGRS